MIQPTPLLLLILTVSWCRAIDLIPKQNEHDIYAIYANANSSSYSKTDVETSAYTIDHRVKEYGQFRYETRMADGVVYGCFGYNDAFGKLRSTHFVADHGGTRILRPFYPSKVYHSPGVATNVEWDEIELPKECQAHEILVNVKPINFKTVADASKFQYSPQLSKVEALKKTMRNKPEVVVNESPPKSSGQSKIQATSSTGSRKLQSSKKAEGNVDDNSIAISLKAGTVQKLSPKPPTATTPRSKSVTNQRGGQKFSTRVEPAGGLSGKRLDNTIGKTKAPIGGQTGEAFSGNTGTKTTSKASTKTGNEPLGFSPSNAPIDATKKVGLLNSKPSENKSFKTSAGQSGSRPTSEPVNGSVKTNGQSDSDNGSSLGVTNQRGGQTFSSAVVPRGEVSVKKVIKTDKTGTITTLTAGAKTVVELLKSEQSSKINASESGSEPVNGSLRTSGQQGVGRDNGSSLGVEASVNGTPTKVGSIFGFPDPKQLDKFLPNAPKETPSGFSLPKKPAAPSVVKSVNTPKPVQSIVSSLPLTSTKTQQKVSISLGKTGPSFSGVIDGSKLILKSGIPKSPVQNRIPKITEGKPTQIEIVEEDDGASPTLAPITSFTTPKFPSFGNAGFTLPAGFSNPAAGVSNNNNNFPALPPGISLPGFPAFGTLSPNKTVIGNRVDTSTPASNKPSVFGNFPAFPALPNLPTFPSLTLPTLPNFSGGSRTGNAIKPGAPANSVGVVEPIYDRKKIQEFKETQKGSSPAPASGQQAPQNSQKTTSQANSGPAKIPASSVFGLPLNMKNILPSNIGGPINLPPGFSNASPNLQPLGNSVFGKTPSVTNILVGVPQESLKSVLPTGTATKLASGPEASGTNISNQRPVTSKLAIDGNPAPAVQPLANKNQASAFVSKNSGPNNKSSAVKVQVTSPATAAVNSDGNRGSFGLPDTTQGPRTQKKSGFNMIPLPEATRPANVPADCPCLLMTSDKNQQKQNEIPVTQSPMLQMPAVQQLFGQSPFAYGLPVIGFIPIVFVPYCNAGASTPFNLQSFGLPTALPVPYPCSACS